MLLSIEATAQYNQLILRKNRVSFKRHQEGSLIHIQTITGLKYSGIIRLLQNDSIYFNGSGIHKNEIVALYKKSGGRQPFIPYSKELFLYSNAGISLFTAGLVISGESFLKSFLSAVSLVYAPVLFYNIKRLVTSGSKKYTIGNKYDLQVLDLYPAEVVPNKNP
jgi:hypothetical protein